ncbi:MAG: MFS transporter [Alphaproteobacteria bacterium]|nr:MFS transporter [Alphaproteobacteria bacterium]
MSTSAAPPRNVFRYRPFAFLWTGRLCNSIATLAQSVTIGWQVYSIARATHSIEESAFLVGMVGLVQFLPLFSLVLLAGETADRYDRRKILIVFGLLQAFCAAGFALLTYVGHPSLTSIFFFAALFGAARAFMMPASHSITPMLVPRAVLPRAIAWNALSYQSGMIIGPWIAGILCASSVTISYAFSFCLYGASVVMLTLIRAKTKPQHKGQPRLTMIREGLAYLWSNRIVFGAISLDMFAVLLGGVTALLPVYARDILQIGPEGFGLLRSSTAMGAALVTLSLSFWPLRRHAGVFMLGSIAVYGVATIFFALSETLWLSLAALAVVGGADSISIFVRQSLVQIVTPDEYRGRVSSVSGLFISASNELGEFESGVAARLIGPIGAVIFGGVGSIVVTSLWAKIFPDLRKADKLLDTTM